TGYSVLFDIKQHGSLIGVVVIDVVWCELEIPFQFSVVGVYGQNTSCIQVIAGPRITHKIGRCVAGGPIESVEFGIVGAGHPGGAATMQVGISRPTGGTVFSRSGNGPETPP